MEGVTGAAGTREGVERMNEIVEDYQQWGRTTDCGLQEGASMASTLLRFQRSDLVSFPLPAN